MIPFLLPIALAIFAVVGACLLLLIVAYHVVRPDSALLIERHGALPKVLFSGGVWLFPGFGSVATIDLKPSPFQQTRMLVTLDEGEISATITVELQVKATSEAVNQLRDTLTKAAPEPATIPGVAFSLVRQAIDAASLVPVMFHALPAHIRAALERDLPAFRIVSLAVTRTA